MTIRNKIGFVASLTVSAFFLAVASIASIQQRPAIIFPASLMSWVGYISAHKLSIGTFVDGETVEEKEHPSKKKKFTGIALGTTTLVSGMILGISGLKNQDIVITFPAAILFLSGYVIAHYFGTGELV